MDDRFDGFSVRLFMEENGSWLAHFSELPEVSAFADSPENALAELYVAWCGIKETYASRNLDIPVSPARKNYSGVFNVRIDKSLHRALAIEASREGISLNAIVHKKLSEAAKSF